MKLNLGCGTKHMEGYINMDIQEPYDLHYDMREPLPYKDNSIDEVFSENAIYKIARGEWYKLKKEIARVLKPGGRVSIIVHDLEYIFKSFLENKDGRRWTWWWATIYGMQTDEYDFKKNGFTYERLVADLWEEGMTNFKREEYDPEYVFITCYKP